MLKYIGLCYTTANVAVLKFPSTLPGPRQLQDLPFWCFPVRNQEDYTWSPAQGLVPQVRFPFVASSHAWFKQLCSPGSVEVPWLVSWVLCRSKVCVWCKKTTHQQIKSCFCMVTLPPSLLTSVMGGGKGPLIGHQNSFIPFVQMWRPVWCSGRNHPLECPRDSAWSVACTVGTDRRKYFSESSLLW